MDPINEIKKKLKKYPKVSVTEGNSSITVHPEEPDGFDVSFFEGKSEYTVYHAGWHEHFNLNDTENALNCFALGLSNDCRLKVTSRGEVDYKWTLQIYEDGEWISDSVTGLFWFRFWRKPVVRYLQNNLIT